MARTKYFKNKYGMVYGVQVATPVGRIVWPALVKPKEPPPAKEGQPKGQPRYEFTLLLKKGDEQVEKFINYMKAEAKEMVEEFNDKARVKIADVRIIGDGDDWDTDKYPYYAGNYVLVGRRTDKAKFAVVDAKKQPIDGDTVKGGMLGKAIVFPLITPSGLSYQFDVLQVTADDGTRFGGGIDSKKTAMSLLGGDEPEETEDETEEADAEVVEEAPAEEVAVATTTKKGKKSNMNLL